ncbi:haloacid dehalogenase type II [Nakamurella endophytica]|uniref:Haloacid dehalogenase n=1 Tax=Nakamurella endophytica TaxID=1748367 RepID=A0A917SS46_9ACTN|nr:haloacid dehalogenase type II [Nakamurella endophytica]GGL96279.1 haloacid dehalogenase [Nakamurella endophytica]
MAPQVAVFDVLGTVLDERSGFRAALTAVDARLDDPDGLVDRWLDRISARVAAIAAGTAGWRPWEDLIDEGLAEVAPEVHRHHGRELATVGRRLPAWPDSARGIAALRGTCRVVALSNAGLLPLVDCSRAAGITWDAVLSAGMVRSTKPDPQVYGFLLDQLGLDPAEVVMVAAHPWDLRAAAEQGLRTAYVRRPDGEPDGRDDWDWSVGDLVELSTALRD